MKTIWDVIKAPVVTEKAMKAKGDLGETIGNQVLTFIVAHSANKNSIKYAVETIFKRKVGAVQNCQRARTGSAQGTLGRS